MPVKSEQVQRLEENFDEAALALWEKAERQFRPLFPWVFVRILSKEQKLESGIIVPNIEQNKTVHEGIVLAVWEPFPVLVQTGRGADGKPVYRDDVRTSSLQPGDHVMLPHWAGLPVAGFSDKHYRVVKEEGWRETQDGGIFATVQHADKSSKLESLIGDFLQRNIDGDFSEELAQCIREQFLLVDRDGQSVTLSGR